MKKIALLWKNSAVTAGGAEFIRYLTATTLIENGWEVIIYLAKRGW